MIEQQGVVVAASGDQLSVRLGGRAGCAACDAGRGCGAGVFGRLLKRRPVDLAIDNHLEARAGQAVVVGLPEAWFLQLVARFYLYPLLAGLVAGVCGHYVCRVLGSATFLTDLVTLAAAIAAGTLVLWRNRNGSAGFTGPMGVHLLRVVENDELIDEKEVVS